MHRDTETARWYRRIDPSCFAAPPSPDDDRDAGPAVVPAPFYAAYHEPTEPRPAASLGWIGSLARRLSATRA